jgi:catechol 2,3-dioxygenase-like lactoylglutathione lyase family enzyme
MLQPAELALDRAALTACRWPYCSLVAGVPGNWPVGEGQESAMNVNRLDHLVLTVASIDVTVDFYTRVLGMEAITFGMGRTALRFGTSKINLHEAGQEFEPKALFPTPGSADICLIVDDDIATVIADLAGAGITIEEGPVDRTGATGPIVSCYLRDPDQNLIELSNYAL